LLELVNDMSGVTEVGFITSHPKDTSVRLFEAMAGCDKVKKYLHLPLQSGSDRILKEMNRGYTAQGYMQLARQYRKIVKGGVLTTDIIVGFPTETEEDFLKTRCLVEDAVFDAAYIFKYSPRPNTQAAMMADDVEKKERKRRHKVLLDLQKAISIKKRNIPEAK